MNQHLKNLINLMQKYENDKYNSDTYFKNNITGEAGVLNSQYVLGNLFAKGYSEAAGVNFEIYKDHSTWQVWVWKFNTEKPEYNQFSVPYYKYQEVIEFFESM